jgi:hypothetical protein
MFSNVERVICMEEIGLVWLVERIERGLTDVILWKS